ncbi:MAG: heme peroxidase [Methylococcaceae bacterium]|nr:heme peroxidase [Methylococcaceae bacterium]
MAKLSISDLKFIFKQIQIAEAHAGGADLASLVPNAFAPLGLRTVDGSYNNLLPGQNSFGAADNNFPFLLGQVFRDEADDPPFVGVTNNNYATTTSVVDADPRIISNLIVDQTISNPVAVETFVAAGQGILADGTQLDPDGNPYAAGSLLDLNGVAIPAGQTLFIPNVTPDEGLSAPFNSWMTLFGQFFDHGLDLINKGGNGTVYIPLQPDDPLIGGADGIIGDDVTTVGIDEGLDDLQVNQRFMAVTRASTVTDTRGTADTSDDIHYFNNQTTPFVDQNQTYTSHSSHQVFLREYELDASGHPVATGKLLDGASGGLPTWAEVKAQAATMLGIQLIDTDVLNVPLLRTDAYGKFIPGANGFAQLIIGVGPDGIPNTADDSVLEGNPLAPVSTATAFRTNHAFLDDIAHNAAPGSVFDTDGNPGTPETSVVQADTDTDVGNVIATDFMGRKVAYDDELLDAHFITGDGRGNENIGLTTVHHIFHSEHNRQVAEIQATILADAATNGVVTLNDWLVTDVAAVPTDLTTLNWDGERLFQAARFATEMQYQHIVFEEFARKVQPNIDAFLAPIGYDVTINPAIVSEFANVVYRFGHSMLTETVDRYDPDFNPINADPLHQTNTGEQIGLIEAFLNPLAFVASDQVGVAGDSAAEAAGAIVRGMTRQMGNEIDEFVTDALRNNLVGLPLDLAAINIARGRDTGVPSFNAVRREFFNMTQDSQLAAYVSWADLAANLKHEASIINFIAAYGTHAAITSATTLADKRAAATLLVLGDGTDGDGVTIAGITYVDRLDFLNSTGDWANNSIVHTIKDVDGVTTTGLGNVDLWIGGLAEKQMPFGGMLGSTFNFVFETQMEMLQNADRFYYLARTAGLDFGAALENNSFAKLIMLNTDATHLPSDVFTTPGWILEVDALKQYTGLGVDGRDDPEGEPGLIPLVIRDNPETADVETNYLRYTGEDHVVLGGTDSADTIISSIGDDTIYGDGGNDRIEGGDGVDNLNGGAGDDIITDLGGDDVIHGDAGNDVIQGGNGINLIHGESGQDFVITGEDISTVFAGTGNDFVLGSSRNLEVIGGEGNDWLEFGHQEGTVGDNFDANGADLVKGHDVIIGGGAFEDIIAEGGDDIIFGSDGQEKMDGASGFDWADYKFEKAGVTADLKIPTFSSAPATPSTAGLLDLYAFVEGLSGTAFGDVLRGDDTLASEFLLAGAQGSVLDQAGIARIAGLQTLLGAGVTSFSGGNIILGGDGSDIIEGRRGDDIIDGDRWLNARISVRDASDHDVELFSVDSMRDLIPRVLSGEINPGQLEVVREILVATGPDFDTAVYSGARANYTVSIAFDGTVTVRDNVGTILGTEGTDTLHNIERLQFSDQVMVLPAGEGLNAGPVGQLTISDDTPAINQQLTVSAAGITDANISGASISGKPISYYWQVERPFIDANGVTTFETNNWEDIIVPNGQGGAATTADGPSLTVPELTTGLALEGLRLRVRAVYQDDNGVMENVYSAPTTAVTGVIASAPSTLIPAEGLVDSAGIHLIRADLQFILDQIVVAEHHAAGESLLTLVGNERMPLGLRTVDGSYNNLVAGQSGFGAADNNFPFLLDQAFRNDQDGDTFGPVANTDYGLLNGANNPVSVADADPRIISNLIVDQTADNPAAYAAAYDPGVDGVLGNADNIGDDVLKDGVSIVASPGLDGVFGTTDDKAVFKFNNSTPDEGLSAPFNSWMTLFGQFFDHGLDLINKGGNGTVYIPLQPDDPLIGGADGIIGDDVTTVGIDEGLDDLQVNQRFMAVTRASTVTDTRGTADTSDDIHYFNNQTTPFVDQNQTYTSHSSHQVFLREYELDASGHPVATGKLLDGASGGLPTWAEVKAQAATMLGIQLIDTDVLNVPLLRTDAYGKFIPGANGFAQLIIGVGPDGIPNTADDSVLEGNPLAPVSTATAFRTNHAFLDDIAHNAAPGSVFDTDGNPGTPETSVVQADTDTDVGNVIATDFMGRKVAYDDELLDAHFITGDGRGNENIGLTTVHHVFHAEHNRLVAHIQDVAIASNDVSFLNQWLTVDVVALPVTAAAISALQWDGERLFQAARFATEMQYQHLVFEEFARTVQPQVDLFFAAGQVYDTMLNPAIVSEFANVVYRFGHSMLTETVDRYDPAFNIIDTDPLHPGQTGSGNQIGLIAAFLNPLAFAASGADASEAAGTIVRGMTRQVGNEIDEFVTEALRNNLVGLPLDLAAINIARGRDTGVPSLNAARQEFYTKTGDAQLAPYTSWVDFASHLKHEESVVNFIAAYGTHSSITSATTLADKRAAATDIVLGGGAISEVDRLAFLNGSAATTGVNDIDLWIGGLAEKQMPFGGLLGSTFNFVFETQMENLQDGDRFYYLERTAGLNFLTELEGNSFAKLIMANTDATHLPGNVFTTPTWTLEVNPDIQFTGLGITSRDDPTGGSSVTPLVIRDNPATPGSDTNYLRYTGEDHVVLGGTDGDDILVSSIGDDTLYGDAGNDRLEGGDGVDMLLGGIGDDIITDLGGDDVIQGGDGNDAIQGGNGINLVIGGFGQDFINTGEDASEAFGGPGNDFILGSRANEQDMGNEGDDWLEHGNADGSPGDNFDPFGRDQVAGNDVYIGDTVVDIMNAEGGDDIMIGNGGQQDHYLGASGFDWADYKDSPVGVIVFADLQFENEATALGANPSTLDRYQSVEGYSGSHHGDILVGGDNLTPFFATSGFNGSILTNEGIDRIDGLRDILPVGATSFTGEILLGGGGSDYLKGGWGDEVIDGDAWLNVQIGVYAPDDVFHTGTPILRFNSMTEMQDRIFSGEINPGQLAIIREIRTSLLDDTSIGPDFDTAVFGDVMANYTVEFNDNGTENVADDFWVVTDILTGLDGVDIVRNVERLQFSDQALIIGDGVNSEPEGSPTIIGTPTEDQLLTVSISGVTDADNITLANPDGNITGTVTYYWEMEGTGGIFTPILKDNGVTLAPVTGTTFQPTDLEVGFALRVRAVYKDANDVIETVYSAPTAPVIAVNDAPVGTVLINDTTPTETRALVAINAFTDADDPVDALGGGAPPPIVYNYQWQQANLLGVGGGSGGFSNIVGATSAQFTPDQAQVNRELRVVVSYVDGQGFNEIVTSAATIVTGDFIAANGLAQTLTGTQGQDEINGGAGNDIINALGQDDILNGGADNDTINAGAGNDTINYTMGDGTDTVNAGAGSDTLAITGTVNPDTLDVLFNGTVLTNVEGGAVTLVEAVTADLVGNIDTLSYNGTATAVAVAVNLTSGAASGFTRVTNIENVTGHAGIDTFTGDGNANILNGVGGVDTLNGAAGSDVLVGGLGNDILNGDAGNDTFNYTFGDGADAVNGGVDVDTLNITGTAVANTLDVVFNGTALTSFEGGTVLNVEAVTADLLDGTDTLTYAGTLAAASLFVNLAIGSASGFSMISNIENVTGGDGNDELTGNLNANTLNGGAGNDLLNGGAGIDILNGGAGNDRFIATILGDDNDSYSGGANIDTYDLSGTSAGASVTTVSATSLDIGTDTLATIENIIGSQGNDTITFNGGVNVIDAQGGNDTIVGGAGNDVLSGGAGNDTFNYTFGHGADAVDGGADTDSLNITGTVGNDTLDVLYNGISLTNFEGGTVTGVELVTANLLGGNDTLTYAGTTSGVNVNLAAGLASGFLSLLGIENAIGGSGADTLTGSTGALILNTINGGAGDDTYIVDGGETVTEAPGGGTDMVFSSAATFTISNANVENLTLTGNGNINGTGNNGANIITGNNGNNTLTGLGGVDTLFGGLGDDLLNGGAGNDFFVYNLALFGDDNIQAFDANAAGGQDLLDFRGSGLTLANIGITSNGIDTVVTVNGTETITLLGVTGVGANAINTTDFIFG